MFDVFVLFAIVNSPLDGIAKTGCNMVEFLFNLAILLVTSRQSQSPVNIIKESTIPRQINVGVSAVNSAQRIRLC